MSEFFTAADFAAAHTVLDAPTSRAVEQSAAYRDGFDAAATKYGVQNHDSNPYKTGTAEHADWLAGYMCGLPF